MYDLTKEFIIKEHIKDLHREAEKYYILNEDPCRLLNSPGFCEKCLTYLGRLLSNLRKVLQVRVEYLTRPLQVIVRKTRLGP